MSFIVQSCLMHEEAYVLTRFFSCLILWLSILLHHPCLRGSRAVCNSASHCVEKLLLFREKKQCSTWKRYHAQTIPQPSQWMTGRVSCLTAWIKACRNINRAGILTVQKYFFLVLSTPRLGSAGQAAAIPAAEVTLQLLLLPWAAASELRAVSAAVLQKSGKEEEETREQFWEGE